jgi:hypothetical protein
MCGDASSGAGCRDPAIGEEGGSEASGALVMGRGDGGRRDVGCGEEGAHETPNARSLARRAPTRSLFLYLDIAHLVFLI